MPESAQLGEMDAIDHLSDLRRISSTSRFNEWLGLQVVSAAPGRVEISLDWRDDFGQYSGFLHAALVTGLLDTACGFAALTVVGPVISSQISVRFLRPAVASSFLILGRVVKPGRQQIFTTARIVAKDAPDKLLAEGETLLVPLAT